MYARESWPIKKAEQRIDVFELWCWRRLLRVPWTARRSNQSIQKVISPEYSLEGLMLKLKLQSFGHLMRRTESLEKTLMLGKIEPRRRRGWQRMRWLDGITDSMDMIWICPRSWWWTGKPGVLQCMGFHSIRHYWETELNWTKLINNPYVAVYVFTLVCACTGGEVEWLWILTYNSSVKWVSWISATDEASAGLLMCLPHRPGLRPGKRRTEAKGSLD